MYTSEPLCLCTEPAAHLCVHLHTSVVPRLRALRQAGSCFTRQHLRGLGPFQDHLTAGGKLRPCATGAKVFDCESIMWYGGGPCDSHTWPHSGEKGVSGWPPRFPACSRASLSPSMDLTSWLFSMHCHRHLLWVRSHASLLFSPPLLTALNWLHFNTKSRHFFFFKVLSFLESPWGRSRRWRWLLWTLFWLSGTNVDFSEHLLSLLECNCLGPSQFLESGVQGVSWSQVWLCAACRVPSQISPELWGLVSSWGK